MKKKKVRLTWIRGYGKHTLWSKKTMVGHVTLVHKDDNKYYQWTCTASSNYGTGKNLIAAKKQIEEVFINSTLQLNLF